jgi:hypothetical protein
MNGTPYNVWGVNKTIKQYYKKSGPASSPASGATFVTPGWSDLNARPEILLFNSKTSTTVAPP